MEEAEPELTHREFLAVLIREMQNPSTLYPYWLCTNKYYRKKALKIADKMYETWKQTELSAREARRAGIAPNKGDSNE